MNFYCIFPNLKNVDLIKHVGLTPYYLSKECNYNSTIVSFNNDNYSNLDKVTGLNLEFFKKKYKLSFLNHLLIISYIIKNANNIDVLNCYHYGMHNMLYFLVYKLFNRRGIAYFTFDTKYENVVLLTCTKKNIKCLFRRYKLIFLFKYIITFANIEHIKSYELFYKNHEIYRKKLMYMPIFIDLNQDINEKKKNQIISVARIGSNEKASDIILESFKQAMLKEKNKNWTLKMVGPISKGFEEHINKFFNENPKLKDSIIFTGNIEDKNKLYKMYSESKIFLLPSRYESWGIVFAEALFYSNYLITTNVGIAEYLIEISNFGELVEIDNIEDISNKLVNAMNNYDDNFKNNNIDFKKLIQDEFSYKNYIYNLDSKLNEIKHEK